MEIHNPHDKFFKETLGKVAVAEDFLLNYLPPSIKSIVDITSLEPQKDSFISRELQESYTDLLFKTRIKQYEGYIYFLFEHKSYPSRDIAYQLLRYMVDIWAAKIEKEGLEHLPIIIPLVVYHGQQNWRIKTTLGALIPGYEQLSEDVKSFVPDYKYLLYDVSEFTDDEIKGQAQLKILLTMFRDIHRNREGVIQSILRSVGYLQELEDKQTGIECLKTMMSYVFGVGKNLGRTDVDRIIKEIETTYPEGSEAVMTIAEMLRAEGREEGREEGRLEVVKNAIKEGMELALISKLTGFSKEEVEKIARAMAN
ncbi:MAG TPA: Rpn family recombination-promoting nuclease/putative transposase [Firmicutes bacterium]|nr:Rpn family recombination-promoting nuclease/putative transposase [Clostridiales bacterium]HHV07275.1 Rpn family recombination-promoting nuclease/putative transposase [Bacillota bacterium]